MQTRDVVLISVILHTAEFPGGDLGKQQQLAVLCWIR